VPDPEIPVISLTDLGIIRDVEWRDDTLVVTVTPTYSGCPATTVINLDIETALTGKGLAKVKLERRLSPAWTTDWISAEGREKLRDYGIAPPIDGTAADGVLMKRIDRLSGRSNLTIACPRCGSANTEKISQFGSTPCKASYRCTDCLEPFDYFKCI
jgi:ring-1,2-phenylacetyl-CoA epoxidase subunit PaaD